MRRSLALSPDHELLLSLLIVDAWDLLKEVVNIFITSTIVWSQVNSREGTQLYPSIENWIKDLLSKNPDAGLPL